MKKDGIPSQRRVLFSRKILSLLLTLTMLSLVACGNSNASLSDTGTETNESMSATAEESEDAAEDLQEEETATEESVTPEEETTEDTAETTQEAESDIEESKTNADDDADTAVAGNTEAYIDFEDMSFYINGIKYTLGVTTLQDMIDDGVPFDEDDIANAGNNLNANYQSGGFKIVLGDYWTAQVYVLNDTDSNKVASECYINKIYLPVKTDRTQDILSFAFPVTITMEELVANAGDPDDSSHYDGDNGYYSDTYEYIKESEIYYSDSKYTFEFTKGELTYLTITYMP